MKQQKSVDDPIWYPFTSLKNPSTPIKIVKGKGTLLYTDDGRVLIDAISSWWVNIHGHSNEYIAQAISQQASQLEHVIFAGFTHEPAQKLANNLLSSLLSSFTKVFFSDDGSTAVEVGLKLSIQYWKNKGILHKNKILAFENAYHGDTFGAMSASGKSIFNQQFAPFLFEVVRIPLPTEDNIDAILQSLRTILLEDDIAAFIYEPLVQGAGGMQMTTPALLDQILAFLSQKEIILIADEVMTGFGRTGQTWASDYMPTKPDIMAVSKGITGGFLPLGVSLISNKIVSAFDDADANKTFFHGHSYTANPITCAAANASWELLQHESCQKKIDEITERHKAFIKSAQSVNGIENLRNTGTILAFDIKSKDKTSYLNDINQKIKHLAIEKGVLLRPLGNVVYTLPPYSITDEELTKVYDTFIEIAGELST